MSNIEDLLGYEDDGRPETRRSKKARKSLGPLHDLMTNKYPHLIDKQSGVCNLHRIAELRGMSFQGVYKWFRKQRLPFYQAMWLIDLSKKFADSDRAPADYVPMTIEDMQPYISQT